MNAGRIEKNDLRIFQIHDAFNGGSRGLRFLGNNGQLPAHQGIQERGFAGIGPS